MRSAANFRSHPVHPMLVVFPIAFFTGALLFDAIAVAGSMHSLHAVGFYLCWAGVAGAVAAAVPGVIDLVKTVPPNSSASARARKHALLNTAVLVIFIVVIVVRRSGFELYMLITEAVAVAIMYISGWMGATLVHRNQIGVDHRYAQAGKWKEMHVSSPEFPLNVASADELKTDQMKLLTLGGRRIVLARAESGYVAFDDRCPHRGGSLAGGVMMCGKVHCPWHGSQFDVSSGECMAGPAEAGIQVYPVKEENGRVYLLQIN